MVKCAFCGREESPVRGVHLIQNDGNISYFCTSKCRKSALKLKRDRRKLKWTQVYKATLAKNKEKQAAKAQN